MSGHATQDARESLDALVRLALAEDVGPGDRTTEWTVPADRAGTAVAVAKETLVVAGGEVAREVFRAVDASLGVELLLRDGADASPGDEVLTVRGPVGPILTAERTALNFLGRLSGIATLTRRYVDAVAGTGARIVDTRKTAPGYRLLDKAAVRAGGGENHRMGLYDMVLIKENHIAAAGGIGAAVRRVREHDRNDGPGLAVEVEVTDLAELEEALELGVDRVLLDNMEPEMLERCVERARRLGDERPELEASGNVTLETVRRVATTGVDLVSVGALTHSAPAADLSLGVRDG